LPQLETALSTSEVSLAQARGDLYCLLAYAYSQLPRPGFLEGLGGLVAVARASLAQLSAPGFPGLAGVEGALERLAAQLRDSQQEGDRGLQELAVEATRLLRGLRPDYGPPPPYESVYREGGQVMGLSAQQVRQAFGEVGYTLPPGGEPPDHVGIELDFMGHLCHREASAEAAEAATYQERGRQFLREHLLPWVPRWCHQVAQQAHPGLYRGLAELTTAFLQAEGRWVGRGSGERDVPQP